MIYEYDCPNCLTHTERVSTVAERHNQRCDCGAMLVKRDVASRLLITVPTSFVETTGDPCEPTTAEERRTWDEEGVRPYKGS